MNKIDQYFNGFTSQVSYIELKKIPKELEGLVEGIDLPVPTEDFLEGIKEGEFDNEISLNYVVDGILLNLAIDKNFKYRENYEKIYNILVGKDYGFKRAGKAIKDDDENKLLYIRGAYILDSENIFLGYSYASNLWRDNLDSNDSEEFNKEAINILEKTLKIDDKYVPSLYELGEINFSMGNYIKSQLYYEEALKYTDDIGVKEEIREKINQVKIPAGVEDAIYHIQKGDYQRAIKILNKVNSQSNRYDSLYYLGVSYLNLGEFDRAIEYFESALKYKEFPVLFNDYIYALYVKGDIEKALSVSNEALELYPADIRIRYNRAMIYRELGFIDKAIDDLNFILEYDDLSDELFSQIMEVKVSFENNM